MIRLTKSGFENADPQTLVGKWVSTPGKFVWPCFARPLLVSSVRGASAYGHKASLRQGADGTLGLDFDEMEAASLHLTAISVVCDTNAEAAYLITFSRDNMSKWQELTAALKASGDAIDGMEILDPESAPSP